MLHHFFNHGLNFMYGNTQISIVFVTNVSLTVCFYVCLFKLFCAYLTTKSGITAAPCRRRFRTLYGTPMSEALDELTTIEIMKNEIRRRDNKPPPF